MLQTLQTEPLVTNSVLYIVQSDCSKLYKQNLWWPVLYIVPSDCSKLYRRKPLVTNSILYIVLSDCSNFTDGTFGASVFLFCFCNAFSVFLTYFLSVLSRVIYTVDIAIKTNSLPPPPFFLSFVPFVLPGMTNTADMALTKHWHSIRINFCVISFLCSFCSPWYDQHGRHGIN